MTENETPRNNPHQDDRFNGILWALILIWAGIVLLAANLGWLKFGLGRLADVPGLGTLANVLGTWPLILLGAGVILLIGAVVRLAVPALHRPVTGMLILAVVFIGVALGDLLSWNLIWPVILILLGLSMIFRRR